MNSDKLNNDNDYQFTVQFQTHRSNQFCAIWFSNDSNLQTVSLVLTNSIAHPIKSFLSDFHLQIFLHILIIFGNMKKEGGGFCLRLFF